MKKFLSLVLALVMTMSLVTISAGAKDFSDADAVNYDEAVEVLTSIGVVSGYTDGSFKPAANLNRGQAAKIICNLILGSTDADKLDADTKLFSDVPVDHTFAAYIAFCVEEGIVSGYADGSFKPGNELTHYAFLKMLLGALGYESETEGYIGDNWSINVAKRALAIGLTKGLDGDFNGFDTVTREEACLYALNTLKATMVEYDQKTVLTVGDAKVNLSGNINEVSWGEAKKNDGNIEKDGFVQFAEKNFPKLELKADEGLYGRPTNEWKNAKKLIGAYASIEPTYVYTESTDEKDVYKDLGEEIVEDFSWTVYINGVMQDTEIEPSKKSDDEWAYTGEGTVTEIYVNDTERTVVVVEYNYYLGQVTKVKSDDDGEYITVKEISQGSSLDEKTFYVEGYEEDDYVIYTEAWNEDDDESVIGEIINPETVTVEVTRVQKDDNTGATYLRADGEKYIYTEDSIADDKGTLDQPAQQDHIVYDLDENTNEKTHPELNKDYILYLDPNGFVLGYEIAEEKVTEYLYVIDSDEEMGEWTAKVLLADGTKVIVELDEDECDDIVLTEATEQAKAVMGLGWKVAYDKVQKSNIDELVFEYSVNEDGEYDLDPVTVEEMADGVTGKDDTAEQWYLADKDIKNGKAYIDTGDANKVIVDTKTIFVDEEGKTAYVGYKEVPNIDDAEIAYVVEGKVVVIAFVLDGEVYDSDSTYFMLSSQDRESLKYDSKTYWEYEDAYVAGEKTAMTIIYDCIKTNDSAKDLLVAGQLYKVLKTKDESYITEIEVIDVTAFNTDAKDGTFYGTPNTVASEAFWLDLTAEGTDMGEVKFDIDDETIFVYAEYNKTEDEWSISEGNLKDMDDEDVKAVAVVASDEEYAELVYIFAEIETEVEEEEEEEIVDTTGFSEEGNVITYTIAADATAPSTLALRNLVAAYVAETYGLELDSLVASGENYTAVFGGATVTVKVVKEAAV